jgi:hypothetical protein
MSSSSLLDTFRGKIRYQDEDPSDDISVEGGGDRYEEQEQEEENRGKQIRQDFSPIYRTGDAMKLARCLYKLGVSEQLVQRCSEISLQIFMHLEKEALADMTKAIPMGAAILRAAQLSLKEELAMEEEG